MLGHSSSVIYKWGDVSYVILVVTLICRLTIINIYTFLVVSFFTVNNKKCFIKTFIKKLGRFIKMCCNFVMAI